MPRFLRKKARVLLVPFVPSSLFPGHDEVGVGAHKALDEDGSGFDGFGRDVGAHEVHRGQEQLLRDRLIGTDGDLYGARVKVELLSFIRPETRFAGVEELKAELAANKKQAEEFFSAKL